MPRHPHEPTDKTRAEVEALKSFGVPQEDIAGYIGIDRKTLAKHYREELDTAQTKANATVARFLYQAASGKALNDLSASTSARVLSVGSCGCLGIGHLG